MCDQADIGDSWSIAAAEAPGARVTCKYVFDRVTVQIKPVREPLHSSWLIEMKFLFEIFSHARDDKGMRVHSQHLSKPAYMRSCAQIYRLAGPIVFICSECVELCMDIFGEENKSSLAKSRDGIPTPKVSFGVQFLPAHHRQAAARQGPASCISCSAILVSSLDCEWSQ